MRFHYFSMLPHLTYTAHKHFEHAFARANDIANDLYQTAYEHHLEGVTDPEYADTPEYRAKGAEIWVTHDYWDDLARTYRACLGRHHTITTDPSDNVPF